MKTPINMSQIAAPTEDLKAYEIILPAGTYAAGTYTIPNGRTWDDFYLLILVGGRSGAAAGCSYFPDEMFSSTGWLASMFPDRAGTSWVQVDYDSATTYVITRNLQGAANMLIGYLK